MQPEAYAVVSTGKEVSSADGGEGAAEGHASVVEKGVEDGWCADEGWERTYAAEGGGHAYPNWQGRAVDGPTMVLLVLDHDLLLMLLLGRSAERGWWWVAVDVGVVGYVCVVGHWLIEEDKDDREVGGS